MRLQQLAAADVELFLGEHHDAAALGGFIGERRELCGVGQFLSTVSSIDTPESTHRIKDLVAIRIPDVNAISFNDDTRAARCQVLEVREGMQEMRTVQGLDLYSVNHGIHSPIHPFDPTSERHQA